MKKSSGNPVEELVCGYKNLLSDEKVRQELDKMLDLDWENLETRQLNPFEDLIYEISPDAYCALIPKIFAAIDNKGRALHDSFIICSFLNMPQVELARIADDGNGAIAQFQNLQHLDEFPPLRRFMPLSYKQLDQTIWATKYLIEKGKFTSWSSDEGTFETELKSFLSELERSRLRYLECNI